MAQCPNCKLSSTVKYLHTNYYDSFDDHNDSIENYLINYYYCQNCDLQFKYSRKTHVETEQEKIKRERRLKLKKIKKSK